MFQIRKAVREDSETLLKLIKELADYEKMSKDVVATVERIETSIFVEGRAQALIAEENGEPVGFAIYFYNYSTFLARPGLYLEDLYIQPQCRGKGYGKEMLSHLAGIAVSEDCGRFEWTVLDWNKPAKDFYESLGAAHKKSWEIYSMTGDRLRNLAEKNKD